MPRNINKILPDSKEVKQLLEMININKTGADIESIMIIIDKKTSIVVCSPASASALEGALPYKNRSIINRNMTIEEFKAQTLLELNGKKDKIEKLLDNENVLLLD